MAFEQCAVSHIAGRLVGHLRFRRT